MSSGSKKPSKNAAFPSTSSQIKGKKSLTELSEEEQLRYALRMSEHSAFVKVKGKSKNEIVFILLSI